MHDFSAWTKLMFNAIGDRQFSFSSLMCDLSFIGKAIYPPLASGALMLASLRGSAVSSFLLWFSSFNWEDYPFLNKQTYFKY